MQKENFATKEARAELAEAVIAADLGQYHLVASKGVQEGDPNGETSVTPAWRKTVAHLCSGQGASTTPKALDWASEAIAAGIQVN